MRCSTCGENLEPGTNRCPTCGAAVSAGLALHSSVRRCPRCGYQGDGIPYFKKGSHLALLVGLSFFTYGLGGLGYWLFRKNRVICPNCGLAWHSYPQPLPPPHDRNAPALMNTENQPRLPRSGIVRRVFGAGLVLAATITVVLGIVNGVAEAVGVGSVLGATGTGAFWWGLKGLNERRKALMQRLQQKVLRLATQRGGTLTVTEVASDMSLSLPAAEKVLVSMDDGFRVRSEISKDGVLYYEFPEVLHRGELGPGTPD